MKQRKNFALRSSRKGKGLLPPNPNRWEHEHNALDLRDALGVTLDSRLCVDSAFGLLDEVLGVMPHTQLPVDAQLAAHFAGSRSRRWSGMCIPLPEGDHLVVYNNGHPATRVRATLMEEFFHLWLGHPPTKLRMLPKKLGTRTFDSEVESEAYGSGAAALVPYKSLRTMVQDGCSSQEIASHFEVSEPLVTFRMRVARIRGFQ
jgi:hypothetical protein